MFWDELDSESQRDILDYYKQIEKRTPKTSGIFVCPNCKHVYDDFSGEKMSLDGDNASFCKICMGWHVNYLGQSGPAIMAQDLKEFRAKNSAFLDKTECLSCGRKPFYVFDCIQCDTKFKVMGCRKCKTLYGWIPMMKKRFWYTVPLTSERVIEDSPIWKPL